MNTVHADTLDITRYPTTFAGISVGERVSVLSHGGVWTVARIAVYCGHPVFWLEADGHIVRVSAIGIRRPYEE